MSRIDPDLSGVDFWDALRTEALEHNEDTGNWAVSDNTEVLAAHVDEFAVMVMEPETVQIAVHDDHTMVQGRFHSRFCFIPGTDEVMFRVAHSPFCGEMAMITTYPVFSMLHTNAFPRQFSAAWAAGNEPQ